jgi:hypothetical protein
MHRRQFFSASLSAAAGFGAVAFTSTSAGADVAQTVVAPEGPVTLYLEFRVSDPEHDAALAALNDRSAVWRRAPGFLSLMLKQMSGDSTMVKNYPEAYKGALAQAYLDGAKAHTQPFFYSLFVRFVDYSQLTASQVSEDFSAAVLPHLRAVMMTTSGPVKSPQPMAVYRGVFQTVTAGDRTGVYTTPAAILDFLRHPIERPESNTVTVANHVMVTDAGYPAWENSVSALLRVAQDTYQPSDDPGGLGLPGAKDNRFYRKALSTEILRNAFPDGALRAYLMHGVWDSVWDHENSHLDARFLAAAAPVGAAVEVGPVEPFYLTRMLVTA